MTGAIVDLVEPATGEPFAQSVEGSPEDVERAVRSALDAFHGSGWPRLHPHERGAVLHRIAELVRRDLETLAELESQNNGQPLAESLRQVKSAATLLEYYGGLAPTVHGESPTVEEELLDVTRRRPFGVCGLITAFNAPLHILVMKAAPALVTGNAVVAKPSPYTPLTAARFAALAAEAGLSPGLLNVVPSTMTETGRALVTHPSVPKLSFTGSTGTGERILADAAPLIKSVTLELGGKSASIVCDDADLDQVLEGSVYPAAFRSCGQICTHRTRVYVAASLFDDLLERFVADAESLVIGDPLCEDTAVGPLISESQRVRVHGMVERAVTEGAALATGGGPVQLEGLAGGAFYRPTVLVGPANDSEIMQEEVFGPVVCLVRVASDDEAVRLANASRYGLAGSVWSQDLGRAMAIADQLEAGNISINQAPVIYPWAPFSGHKQSGLGVEMGVAAMHEYVMTQNLMIRLPRPTQPR